MFDLPHCAPPPVLLLVNNLAISQLFSAFEDGLAPERANDNLDQPSSKKPRLSDHGEEQVIKAISYCYLIVLLKYIINIVDPKSQTTLIQCKRNKFL